MTDQLRCLLIDDQPLVRLGVRRLLQGARYDLEEADDGAAAMDLVNELDSFDVAIVEMRPPGGESVPSGTATIKALLKAQPGIGIVAHGERGQSHAAGAAIDAGARAYVAKSSPVDHLKQAIEAAADSETFVDPSVPGRLRRGSRLTKRQQQILQMLADGHSTIALAKRLGLSTETVKTHTKQILARLSARDRAHAVAIALRNSLIE